MEFGKEDVARERFEATPFDEMEEIEDGLYSVVISGFRCDEMEETNSDSLVFGQIDTITPVLICMDGELGIHTCVDMIFLQYGIEDLDNTLCLEGVHSIYDAEKLLEEYNFNVDWFEGEDIDFLMNLLDEDGVILCTVSNIVMNVPELADLPGLAADHLVIVTGIDFTNPVYPRVIMNDPNADNGRRVCDITTFLSAWSLGKNGIMIVRGGEP